MTRTKEIVEQDLAEARTRVAELEQEVEAAVPAELTIYSGDARPASFSVGEATFRFDGGVEIDVRRDGKRISGWWNPEATRALRDYLNAHDQVGS